MGMTTKQSIYKVQFYNKGELYEIYARSVYQGGLYGFIEVEELLFGERSSVVVDPSEEKLKNEFARKEGLSLYMETQFCFAAEAVLDAVRAARVSILDVTSEQADLEDVFLV